MTSYIDKRTNTNERTNEQYTAPPNPLGRSLVEHAVTRRLNAVLPGSRIITYSFPYLLLMEW
jgi:hypothetical protein